MSGPPRVRSMNQAESEVRPVLGPAGNKARSALELRKPLSKPKVSSVNKLQEIDEKKSPATVTAEKDSSPSPKKKFGGAATLIMRQQQQQRQEVKSFLTRSNMSMDASCSSDASTDSSHSRASTGRISRRSVTPTPIRRKQQQCGLKTEKVEKVEKVGSEVDSVADDCLTKKRCSWVTPNTDPSYAALHDEEWGVPVHEDRKLFELLSLSTALAELTWPTILNKRQTFREVFQDFDPVAVSKLNEKKIATPGSSASSLLSELKLRGIIENARQTCKIIEEFGSFEKYIWGFVNYKPIVSHFRYPRQVPIKTSKADVISKDLVKKGFRGTGPTVVYSFMQVAGITNDHLISCFRFQDCVALVDGRGKDNDQIARIEGKQPENSAEVGLDEKLDALCLSTS